MKATVVLALAIALSACGPKPSSEALEEELDGVWQLQLNSECTYAIGFDGPKYSLVLGCINYDTNRFEAETESGAYTIGHLTDGRQALSFNANKASCPKDASSSADGGQAVVVDLHVGTLTLTGKNQTLVFQRFNASAVNGVVEYGCWDRGAFTPSSIQDL